MHLPEYLQQLKRDGWSLVGLEQTMSSVDLREAVFPEKMVLILGNEKEGVPAEIIQVGEKENTQKKMLDLCIEIPQLGIIRSLNVHVSGSILLWEYTRQMNPMQSSISLVCWKIQIVLIKTRERSLMKFQNSRDQRLIVTGVLVLVETP